MPCSKSGKPGDSVIDPELIAAKRQTFKFSPREAEVWRLRHDEELTAVQIAKQFGISARSVNKLLSSARIKVDANAAGVGVGEKSLVKLKAERAAARRDEIGSRFDPKVLSPEQRSRIESAMADRDPATKIRALESALGAFIARLDDVDIIATVPIERIPKMMKDMTEVLQLHKGEPTAIIKIQDVRKLDEIGKMLLEEARRRGLVIEGEVKKPKEAA